MSNDIRSSARSGRTTPASPPVRSYLQLDPASRRHGASGTILGDYLSRDRTLHRRHAAGRSLRDLPYSGLSRREQSSSSTGCWSRRPAIILPLPAASTISPRIRSQSSDAYLIATTTRYRPMNYFCEPSCPYRGFGQCAGPRDLPRAPRNRLCCYIAPR